MADTGDYFKCVKLPTKIDGEEKEYDDDDLEIGNYYTFYKPVKLNETWYLSFVELGLEKLFKQDLFEKVTDEKLFEKIRNEKIIKG